MTKRFNARWENRDAFAEAAEALGVPTDQIVAATNMHGNYTVLYCPDPYVEEHPRAQQIWAAVLKRDGDDVLVAVAKRRSEITWEQIEAKVEEGLRQKFGEPGS